MSFQQHLTMVNPVINTSLHKQKRNTSQVKKYLINFINFINFYRNPGRGLKNNARMMNLLTRFMSYITFLLVCKCNICYIYTKNLNTCLSDVSSSYYFDVLCI